MAIRYITTAEENGIGSLFSNISSATSSNDIIQPDPTLFPKGTPCIVNLSSYVTIQRAAIVQGGQTRIVITSTKSGSICINHSYHSSLSNPCQSFTYIDVDFCGIQSTASEIITTQGNVKYLTFIRCSFCGLSALVSPISFPRYIPKKVLFQDCAFYGNIATQNDKNTSGVLFISGSYGTEYSFINCTIGANYRCYNSSYSGIKVASPYNTFKGTKTNCIEARMAEWTTPPPSEYGYSSWTKTAYQSMNPRPSSAASWRTGAVATDSTVDLDGNPRKSGGALGAYEYYVGKLTAPTYLSSSNITSDGFTLVWSNVENADSYKVIVNGTTTVVQTNQAIITGLTPITTYTVEVISCDSSGDYLDSDAATIDVTTEIGHLETPTGLTSSSVTSSSATVSWNAVENATDYKVEYRVQGATDWTED